MMINLELTEKEVSKARAKAAANGRSLRQELTIVVKDYISK